MILLTPTSTRLLIRPKHANNESLRGYVSRVSNQNGSSPILNTMLKSLKTTTNAIQEICKLTGCSESILKEHGAYTQSLDNKPARILFGNCVLSTGQVRVSRRNICPKCIAHKGISFCYWELWDYDVCHVHGCYLVSHCSGCNCLLGWANSISNRCACGVRFGDFDSEIAPTTRRLICELIADAMTESIKRADQWHGAADSLGPLNWLFIVSNFVLSILLPAFCQTHLGKICAMNTNACEELLLSVLEDAEYYNHLRKFISLQTFRNQMTMSRALREGILNNKMRNSFLLHYRKIPLPNHIFKMKLDILKNAQMNSRRTTIFAMQTNAYKIGLRQIDSDSTAYL
jgi:hypothetical protein